VRIDAERLFDEPARFVNILDVERTERKTVEGFGRLQIAVVGLPTRRRLRTSGGSSLAIIALIKRQLHGRRRPSATVDPGLVRRLVRP
jgi:hypothetical protein